MQLNIVYNICFICTDTWVCLNFLRTCRSRSSSKWLITSLYISWELHRTRTYCIRSQTRTIRRRNRILYIIIVNNKFTATANLFTDRKREPAVKHNNNNNIVSRFTVHIIGRRGMYFEHNRSWLVYTTVV